MKRLITLLLIAAFVVGGAFQASAAEIKASGQFDFTFLWQDDWDFYGPGWDGNSEDQFQARQRVRTQIDIIASENLKGVLYFEIGEQRWGHGPHGADLSTDGVNIETRRAYIAFNIPETDIILQVGLQGITLPSAVAGNPILDDDAAAAVAVIPVNDMFTIVAAWVRLYDVDNDNNNSPAEDELDAWALILPITGDGWSITPWGVLARAGRGALWSNAGGPTVTLGNNLTYTARTSDLAPGLLSPYAATGMAYNPTLAFGAAGPAPGLGINGPIATYSTFLDDSPVLWAWWVGTAIEVSILDPLTFKVDAMYGSVSGGQSEVTDRAGWYIAAAIDYKLDFMTPSIFGWWASGEDGDARNGSEQIPYVSGTFDPTSFGFGGSELLSADGIMPGDGPEGKWGIGIALKDISFIEDLTHQLRVVYARGTNAADSRRIINPFNAVGVVNALVVGGLPAALPWPVVAPLVPSNVVVGQPWAQALPFPMGLPGGNPLGVGVANPLWIPMSVPNVGMTTADYMWEVNFDHKYQIYENLAGILEIGMVHLQYGDDSWTHTDTNTAWKVGLGLQYKF